MGHSAWWKNSIRIASKMENPDEVLDQEIQSRLVTVLQRRVKHSLVKSLAEFITDDKGEFGVFLIVAVRVLLYEVGTIIAALIHSEITTEDGKLKLRPLLEGLSLAEQSEIGEHATVIRKMFIERLPDLVKKVQSTEKKSTSLSLDLTESLFECLMDPDVE